MLYIANKIYICIYIKQARQKKNNIDFDRAGENFRLITNIYKINVYNVTFNVYMYVYVCLNAETLSSWKLCCKIYEGHLACLPHQMFGTQQNLSAYFSALCVLLCTKTCGFY